MKLTNNKLQILNRDYRLTLCFFMFFLSVSILHSQILNFTKFNEEAGLPSSYIYDINQDKRGFLVVATGNGVTYYDGTVFSFNSNKNKQTDNLITSIIFDKKDELYIGHQQQGIVRKSINSYSNLVSAEKIGSPVSCFFIKEEKIYFGTRVGKVGVLENDKVSYLTLEGASFVNDIISINNSIYFATDNGLYILSNNDIKLLENTEGFNYTNFLLDNNRLLIGTDNGTIISGEIINGDKLKIVSTIQLGINVPVKDILKLSNNNFIVATWGSGLLNILLNSNKSNVISVEFIGKRNGLNNVFISKIFRDSNSNLWIATYGDGLYKLNNDHFRLFNSNTGLFFDNVKSVLAIDRKQVFLGFEKGFQIFNPKNPDSTILFNKNNGFVDDAVTCFAKLSQNNVLVGTESGGLFLYSTLTEKFSNYFKQIGLNGNSNNRINHLNVGNNSCIYISTTDGLFIYNLINGKTIKLTSSQGLPHNNILNTYLDTDNRLWIVAPKSSPAIFKNDSITLLKDLPNFKSYNVMAVCEASKGKIFIATNGDGVYEYDGTNYKQYTINNGLGSNYLLDVAYVQKSNVLICSHQNGFSVFDLNNRKIKYYSNKSQLKGYSNNPNAISVNEQIVYAGTEQGLNKYDITKDFKNSFPPKTSILKITVNGDEYSNTDALIELPYGRYDITLDYIGIELHSPNEVVYKYKLDGLESDIKTTKEKKVEYSKLTYGTYIFHLSAVNVDGVESSMPIKITIVVDKPIYLKWWFLLLLLIVTVTVVVMIIKAKTKQLQANNRRLVQKVKEKTESLEISNHALKLINLDLTRSIDYAKRIQSVLMPKRIDILNNLDAFIYFKPRDIVSGDFYWFHKTKNYCYIAAVDCTGHGVPGAFMSLIGTTLLNQIMNDHEEPVPSLIISKMNEKIIEYLRQSDQETKVSDGMDMALCRIDKLKQELVFCGASRPFYYISNNQLTDYKSCIYSIGGFHEGVDKNFKDEFLKYNEGDAFYLFSDGFGDQFGGEKNRRYSLKRMRELFLKIHATPAQNQLNEVDSEFNQWKMDYEQVDDILVIGVKL